MWRRSGVGVLALALLVTVVAGPRPHLHVANGHRHTTDAHHATDPSRPLLHSHSSPHGHPSPDGGHDHEDIVVLDLVVVWRAVIHPATPEAVAATDVAITAPAAVRAGPCPLQPPAHAPPSQRHASPRAPPPSLLLIL